MTLKYRLEKKWLNRRVKLIGADAAAARAASILDEEPAQIEIMKDYLKRKEVKNEK